MFNNIWKQKEKTIEGRYLEECRKSSDINEHLPVLYRYASDCESVIECGVRGCVSSWALVLGLLHNEKKRKHILLNDRDECDISELLQKTANLPIDVQYQWINDLHMNITSNYDMVFIDTWHVYGQLKRELAKFAPITNKYIIMHDTTVDEIDGEAIRDNHDFYLASQLSQIPVEEILCGLGRAITEFVENNPEWEVREKLTNNNGLTVLKRKHFA